MRLRHAPRIVAPVLTGLLLLAGCGAAGGKEETGDKTTTTEGGSKGSTTTEGGDKTTTTEDRETTTTEEETTTTEEETTTTEDTSDQVQEYAFGEVAEWDTGIAITVSPPAGYTPSEYASVEPGGTNLVFVISIQNESDETYNPFSARFTVSSGNVDGDEFYDFGAGVGDVPGDILPGREAVFKVGFNVQQEDDIVMQVQSDYDSATAIYSL